jgi:hypothetical protein
MKQRLELLKQIEANRQKQEELAKEEFELCKKYIQINDKRQWYAEVERTVGRGKTKRTFLEGRFYWIQHFKDDDTGQVIKIERSRPVKENEKWDSIAVINLVI